MQLSGEQKDIIAHIQSGEITDIYSFVKYYKLGTNEKQDKKNIEDMFAQQYGQREYKCKIDKYSDDDVPIIRTIDEKYVLAKPTLFFSNASRAGIMKSNDYEFLFYYFKPTYICEHIDKIISFIALWQYLKSEGLIIELPQICSEKDMALFLRKTPVEYSKQDLFENNNKLLTSDMSVCASHFFDWEYTLDKESFEICLPYLNIKLFPAPELSIYVVNKYKTLGEIREQRNMRIAFAGVLIALITTVASTITSCQDRGYYGELNKINSSLQEIHKDLSDEEITDFDTGIK